MTQEEIDIKYMRMAINEAMAALENDEVPIGAVVVAGVRVVGRGHNMTETLGDVTAHAEMLAITAATQTLGGKYLTGATLYVTVEPCLMCAGAIAWSQCSRVVYGTPDLKRGYSSYFNLAPAPPFPFHPKATVTTGVLADECADLMRRFFRSKR